MVPKKRRRRDPRPGVLITEPVQQSVSIVEPTQVLEDVQSPIVEPIPGSSSAPPPPEHDATSIKLAKILIFQDSIHQSRGNGICICSGQGGDEDLQHTISELRQEILILKQESIENDLLIGKLDSPYPPVALENPKPSSFSQPPCETSSRPSHLLDLRHRTTTGYRHIVVAEDVEPSSVTSPVVNIESHSHQANTEHPSASFSFSFLGCRCFFVVPIRRLRRAFRFLALRHQSLFASSARFHRRLVDKHCRTATHHH
ncbi:unnamed protein product [Lactuca virosa]|uniref:Uncharacterized protein n=1 Tax=Lactuca virosa TaxID=75947 RepID=A0AAU9P176_9ASTR|nr:unnamed protein product [Lactuca virosa]